MSPDGDCDATNDPQTGTLLVNAGKSRVAGIDYDGRIGLGNFAFTFGGNFLDTKTRELAVSAAIAPYLADREIPFNLVAKTTFTAGMRYVLPIESVTTVTLSGDYYHSSPLSFGSARLPSYDIVNFRADFGNIYGKPIDLSLYMTNAFDERYQQLGAVTGAALGFDSAIFGAPRQYGLSLRYRFGG